MKIKYLFLLVILTSFFAGCKDSDSENLQFELSESAFNDVSYEGATLEVQITSGAAWVASSNVTWCTFVPTNGTGNQKCAIEVQGNLETTARTATVTIKSGKTEKKIEIHQNANEGELHYKLPVIFHVLYQNESDVLQYVSKDRLADILNKVNGYYKDGVNSLDMNLSFTLATKTPAGETLASPGVEYIKWTGEYPIDCDEFMTDETGKYVSLLWDPNEYINVMVYFFKQDNSGTEALGISHLPFTIKGHNWLIGVNETEYSYLSLEDLKFPYSVSINSQYINDESDDQYYLTTDIVVTLAHELGHYLGLRHVFTEDKVGTSSGGCMDSDYCDDTPTYNKTYYDEWYFLQIESGDADFYTLVKREDCQTGKTFISTNIMDYAVSYSFQFTSDQRDRIRHVLTYSPLIPGPKIGQTKTRSVKGPLDLPIRVIK
nr:zinc-dependent metalloproteinase lipoprotein [Parabacteroides goldsteinii]